MKAEIRRALAALGLSEDRIREFSEIVDGVKDRVRAEGLITRKAQPALAAKPKPKAVKTIRLSYAGPGPRGTYENRAAHTLAKLRGAQAAPAPLVTKTPAQRGLPGSRVILEPGPDVPAEDWRRRRFAYAQRFSLAGATAAAANTLQRLERSRAQHRGK